MINILEWKWPWEYSVQDFLNIFESGFRWILMQICNFIYSMIILFLDLFEIIGKANIVDSEIVNDIYQRVGLILGIFMLFRLTFSFIQMMVDPNQISDKEKGVGSLVKKVVVVIAMLAITPSIFTEVFNVQKILLDSHIVEKVILGVEDNNNMSDFSPEFSYYLFSNFYERGEGLIDDSEEADLCNDAYYATGLREGVAATRNFDKAFDCLNTLSTEGKLNDVTKFNGIPAILVGVFAAWVLLMYVITLGMRVAKLAFLQLIAPIPILSYLSPKKDTSFQKWITQCVSTFLDVFIRMAIITFAILLIKLLIDNGYNRTLIDSTGLAETDSMLGWVNIVLILGILLFVKKAPELIGEIFPGMGGKGGLDFGFGLKSRTEIPSLAKRAVGGAAAMPFMAVQRSLQNAARGGRSTKYKNGNEVNRKWYARAAGAFFGGAGGLLTGAAYGVYAGSKDGKIVDNIKKGWSAQAKSSSKKNDIISKGGSIIGNAISELETKIGLPNEFQRIQRLVTEKFDNVINLNKGIADTTGKVRGDVDSITDRAVDNIDKRKVDTVLGDTGLKALMKATGMTELQLAEMNITRNTSFGDATHNAMFEVERWKAQLEQLDKITVNEDQFLSDYVASGRGNKAEATAALAKIKSEKDKLLKNISAVDKPKVITKKLAEVLVSYEVSGTGVDAHGKSVRADAVLMGNVKNAQQTIGVALSHLSEACKHLDPVEDKETLENYQLQMKNIISAKSVFDGVLQGEAFRAFEVIDGFDETTNSPIKRQITSVFDMLDYLSVTNNEISAECLNENKALEEQKRQFEAEAETIRAKANANGQK